MNTNFKKILSFILCAVLLFTTASVAFATDESTRTVVDSGYCGAQGENLTWTLYDDGELVISGEGEMAFYYYSEKAYEAGSPYLPPWCNKIPDVKVITVEEGVTGISNFAFRGKTSRYHRVNLPKSLEYYFSSAFSFSSDPEDVGKTLACCYAGSQNDWYKVGRRWTSSLNISNNYSEITQIECRENHFGTSILGNNGEIMFYNNEEPEVFCKIYFSYDTEYQTRIENHGTSSIYVKYYSGEYMDAKLVWRTEGDACKTEYTKGTPSGMPVSADIISVTHGDFTVIVDLVDTDGTVIASDRLNFFSYVPEDMTAEEKFEEKKNEIIEKIEYELAMANFAVFYTTFMIIIPIIFGPIVQPIAFIIDLIKGDIQL